MSVSAARRRPLAGLGWEIGLLVFMGVLYAAGTLINPEFFGDFHALRSTLRDAARYGVMAVGMTFVIVNRDLDLSVGSTLGLVAVVFSLLYAPSPQDRSEARRVGQECVFRCRFRVSPSPSK